MFTTAEKQALLYENFFWQATTHTDIIRCSSIKVLQVSFKNNDFLENWGQVFFKLYQVLFTCKNMHVFNKNVLDLDFLDVLENVLKYKRSRVIPYFK